MDKNNVFETLNQIDVSKYIEKKNGLNYLSWSHAWQEAKKIYPNINYKIYESETGCIYWTDNKTCWVKTGVTINDLEYIEYLPIMDYRNKSIKADLVTSIDVNKAIQRSLTKCIARHGLGLYLYNGEDIPEEGIQSKYQCADCAKAFKAYKDSNNKVWSAEQIYKMAIEKSADAKPRCKECRIKIENER